MLPQLALQTALRTSCSLMLPLTPSGHSCPFTTVRLDLPSANPYSQEHRLSQTVQGLLHKKHGFP